MPLSDDFLDDGDDTEFLAVATQLEASQHGPTFAASSRPTKRRRVRTDLDRADSDDLALFEDSEESCRPDRGSTGLQSDAVAGQGEPEEDPDYYFPGETGDDTSNVKKSKYKIHVPKDGGQFPNAYFTQTQVGLDVSPGQFRGPVWKKPQQVAPRPPPPPFNPVSGNRIGLQLRKPGSNAPISKAQSLLSFDRKCSPAIVGGSDEQMAARLQAEENALSHQHQWSPRPAPPTENRPPSALLQELADLPSDAFASSSPAAHQQDIITISSQNGPSQVLPRNLRGPQTGLKQMTIFGQPATQAPTASQAASKKHAWPLKSKEEPPTHHKLDQDALKTWTYPTNLGTIRDYQYNIVKRSLFHNTLVALPTGLGKTFIAATVMLNYYRWTTNSQIIFMAPTKPLIAQQMEACYQIVGIPKRDTVLMTGETSPVVRGDEWQEKRVFFMTPQTVMNDLKTGISDPKKLVLLVVDEAHKATGGYAYTEVIAFVRRFNSSFRVLALTATPGSTVEAVQAVIDNLDISRVELRTELSIDISSYTHEKRTETELFDFSDEQQLIMEHLTKALKPSLEKLNTQNAYWSRDPMSLTAYGMNQSRHKWAQSDAGRKAPISLKGMVNAIFTVLSSFGHGIGLLKFHGIVPFYTNILELRRQVESGEAKGKTAKAIVESEDFVKMSNLIRGWINNADFIGHPKLEYLRGVVLNHFLDAGEGRQGRDVPPSATRVMIFASYRDSAEDICRVLKRSEPMIRPHVFVGQSGKAGSDGMNQKKQNAVVQDFKAGKYNTLVATSIGEEGLDIGDVDLIVCYDASASPIRMLQRIGRTGRKRMGRVVLLLMRGKEDKDYLKAQDNYAYIQKTIADRNKYNYHDDRSPRILPKDVVPAEDKRVIDIPIENSQPVDLNEKGRKAKAKGRKRPAKKFNMPDGVRTGFIKASKIGSDIDEGDDGDESALAPQKPPAKKAMARKPSVAYAQPEVAPLPFLQDVLLNDAQQRELERKYAHATGNEANAVVYAPDMSRCPEAFRSLGSTKSLPHGRVAVTVVRMMQAVHETSDATIQQFKDSVNENDLQDPGAASVRLVSPEADTDGCCLVDTLVGPPSRAPPSKKPAIRKKSAVLRTVSLNAGTTTAKPRKKKVLRRSISHGSAAMEGNESSPQPTPADMRIGTQGIDLGSRDTSGEDNDDEADSELEAFIAPSDEIIEAVSSSLPGRHISTPKAKTRGLAKRVGKYRPDDHDADSDETMPSDDHAPAAETTMHRAQPAARKRRVIDDSDTE